MPFTSDCEKIAELLKPDFYHDGNWGFVIYRCFYGDEEKWTSFMDRLTKTADFIFEEDQDANLVKDSFAWTIQSDPQLFDGASRATIRDHFNQWVDSVQGSTACTKYEYPIYADEEVVNAVLAGKNPRTPLGVLDPRPVAWVKVLDNEYEERPRQYSAAEIPEDDIRAGVNDGDEGFPPIEDCKRWNVGWMKVATTNLIPRAYALMQKGGWDLMYKRPPGISKY